MKTQHLATCMVLLAASFGCGSPEKQASASTTAELSPPDDCSTLSEDECVSDDRCGPILGRPIDANNNCFDYAQLRFAACVPKNPAGCDAAVGYARDPEGLLWEFGSLCIPPHWTYLADFSDPPPWCAASDVCSTLSEDECESDSCMSIFGRPLDANNNCFHYSQLRFVACVPNPGGCDEGIDYARDPDGVLWEFGSTCIPPNWTELFGLENPPPMCAASDD